jgi:hypothetical protein
VLYTSSMQERTTFHGLQPGVLISVAVRNRVRRKGEVLKTYIDSKQRACVDYRGVRDGAVHVALVGAVRIVRRRRVPKGQVGGCSEAAGWHGGD